MRRRRTESSIELRKQKKEDQVLKRRNIADLEGDADEALADKTNTASNLNQVSLSLTEIIQIINTTKDNDQLFPAVQSIRKMLSRERKPPIDDVIKANLLHNLLNY